MCKSIGLSSHRSILFVHVCIQADSGIRSRSSAQTGSDQKFNFGEFIKGDLPKKLAIMLVSKQCQTHSGNLLSCNLCMVLICI